MQSIILIIQSIFRFFRVNSIKGQVLFLNLLLLGVGVGAIGTIYLSLQSDAANINMAGRQRMLSQLLAKEVLLVTQGTEQKSTVGKTIALFEASHDKLLWGDPATGINPATDQAIRSQLEKVNSLWKDYLKDLNGYMDTRERAYLETIKSKSMVVLKEMNQAVKMMEALAEKSVLTQARYAMFMISAILSFSLIIFIFVTTKLVTPLQQLTAAFDRGAKGDFSKTLPDPDARETGEMSLAFRAYNTMIVSFSGMVEAVFKNANSVAMLSDKQGKMVESTLDSVRTQHSETDHIATAMIEMNASVQEVTQNAENTAEAARTVNIKAQEGSRIMTDTIGSMGRLRSRVESSSQVFTQLEEESREISTVLEVIRSISQQTNLLALNAAIEAARAGEHGRGFAVVASEVRELAAKTKGSTDEINTMIERLQARVREAVTVMEKSQDDASDSSNQASEAGSSLEIIVSEIDKITQMTTQIATAAQEQSQVTDELSRNIINISSTSESTSHIAEKTWEASQDINRKMTELCSHASQFKIDGAGIGAPKEAGPLA